MSVDKVVASFQDWYQTLPTAQRGFPARGTIGAALVVLERLKDGCDLSIAAHRTEHGAQVAGAGGNAVARILAAHGEERDFLREGGRTNRGTLPAIESMLLVLADAGLGDLPSGARETLIHEQLQGFLVSRVREWHGLSRLRFDYDVSKSTRALLRELLETARQEGKAGALAQHLVGAKLQLRFPDTVVVNETWTTADEQTNRAGDFVLGDTAFHVTVAPSIGVIERCADNLRQGLKTYLVVPHDTAAAAEQMAQTQLQDRAAGVAVAHFDAFVAQNLDELSEFTRDGMRKGLRALLDMYNTRVAAVEPDRSLLVEIPDNL